MSDLSSYNVRVLPNRYCKEYRGAAAVKTHEVPREKWATVWNLDEAIRARHDDEAHIQLVRVPGADSPGDRYPRVGRTWASQLWRDADVPADAMPRVELLVLDLDAGTDEGWDERERGPLDEALMQLVADLRELHGFAYYLSRSGVRLIGKLPEPLDVSVFEDYAQRFMIDLDRRGFPVFEPDAFGNHIDSCCTDLGRLFKLPLVPGSAPDTQPDWYEPNFAGEVDFTPKALTPWTFSTGSGTCGRPTEPRPARPKTFTKTDLKPLKKSDWYDVLTNGDPIAGVGGRHQAMLSAAGAVANYLGTTEPADLYGVLLDSVTAAQGPGEDLGDELWLVCHYVASAHEAEVKVEAKAAEARREVKEYAFSLIADLTGCSLAEAHQYIALGTALGSYFVFDEAKGQYHPMSCRKTQLGELMGSLCPSLVSLWSPKGKMISDAALARKHSTYVVDEIRYVVSSTQAQLDTDRRTLHLPSASVRADLKPTYNRGVDTWLAKLGGEHYEELKSWLALYTDTSRPLCALYIHGDRGVGKTLLANALAEVWGEKPVPYTTLGQTFRGQLLRCPLLYADEAAQIPQFRSADATSLFRAVLGDRSHQIEQKYRDPVWLDGFLRILITANNADALRIREDLNPQDVAAIQQRIGYVRVPSGSASEYLMSMPRDVLNSWIKKEIPEHILWLAENHVVPEAQLRRRFSEWDSDFASTVKVEIGSARTVAEVIGRWWEKLPKYDQPDAGLFAKDDWMWVRSTQLTQQWSILMDREADRIPKRATLYTALRALAPEGSEDGSKSVRVDDWTGKAWPVDPAKVASVLDHIDARADLVRDHFGLELPDAPAASEPTPEPVTDPVANHIDAFMANLDPSDWSDQ